MPCYKPWTPPASMGLPPYTKLACQRCIGCKLQRSAEWATRCEHERKSHRYNTWLTLTYDDEHLPNRYWTGLYTPGQKKIYAGTLFKQHPQRFIRAVRKTLSRKGAASDFSILFEYKVHAVMGLRPIPHLRYYYGGEYGERTRRPHYHICLFGIEFNDKKHTETTELGYKLYESETLAKLWPHGKHVIGDLTWETAAYTARYITKKINGQKATEHYKAICHDTGEIHTLLPEFNDMSRKPGIGYHWYTNYRNDVYKKDETYVIQRGHKTKPPRYYDKLKKREDDQYMAHIKKKRLQRAIENKENTRQTRLDAEEIIKTAATKHLNSKL